MDVLNRNVNFICRNAGLWVAEMGLEKTDMGKMVAKGEWWRWIGEYGYE